MTITLIIVIKNYYVQLVTCEYTKKFVLKLYIIANRPKTIGGLAVIRK